VPIERNPSAIRGTVRLQLSHKPRLRKFSQTPHLIRPSVPRSLVRFGPFEMNLETRELRKHGMKIRLEDKPFELLQMLVSQPGRVFSRDELCAELWPDTFVCFEHSLNTAANKLRAALGDSALSSHFLETVRRRGYRFVGEVRDTDPPASTRKRSLLLVLPFRAQKSDPDMESFSLDFTEEVSACLTRSNSAQFGVLASSTASSFKKANFRSASGKSSEADLILEGSVRISAGHLRIAPQLVQVSDGVCIWSEIYHCPLEDAAERSRTEARSLCAAVLARLGIRAFSDNDLRSDAFRSLANCCG